MSRSTKATPPKGSDSALLLEGLRKALAGPRALLGKTNSLFPNTAKGKQAAAEAEQGGYLRSRSETVPPTTPRGKAKTVIVGELTEQGRRYLLDSDSPKEVLEALLPAVQALATPQPLPAADAFRAEVEKATATCVKAIENAFSKLQTSVESALTGLEKSVTKAFPSATTAPALDPAPVLAALQAALTRIAGTVSGVPSQPLAVPPPVHQTSTAGRTTPAGSRAGEGSPPSPEQIRTVLRQAYDRLCLFEEFQDKLVEIPRLFHEAVRRLPELTRESFHQTLEGLRSERKIELHVLNEVHKASDRHLAIERDGRVFYYVFWK